MSRISEDLEDRTIVVQDTIGMPTIELGVE